ncbi:MAG: TolC family protein [Nitrospinae bacterium]|nr:TolC family protein [Nitrospinota bacterium]
MKIHRRLITVMSALAFFPIIVAQGADYGGMRKEFESYKAPDYYEQNVAGSPEEAAKSGAALQEQAAPELKLLEEKLNAEKKGWEDSIASGAGEQEFFDFKSPPAKKIREAAKTDQILDLLKGQIDLDILIAAAFERNPGLAGAKKQMEASLEEYSQATRLDNLLGQYQAFINETGMAQGSMSGGMESIQKKFPFPGVVALKGDMAAKEVEIASENYFVALRDLIADIKNAYYELLYSGHAIRTAEENLQLLKQLEKIAYIKYDSGLVGYSDVLKVQTRTAKLETDLVTWRASRDTVAARLNKFLNLPPQTALGPRKEAELHDTPLSLQDMTDLGLKRRQELRVLRLEIEKSNIAITMAEKEFFPDFTLGYNYIEGRKVEMVEMDEKPELKAMKPETETPFWFGMNDAYVREARQMYQSMQKELEAQKDKLRFELKDLTFRLDTAKRNAALYQKSLLPLAWNSLEAAKADYQAGKGDFLNVLDAQEIWLEYNLHYWEHVRDQNQAMADLERTVGTQLLTGPK